MGSAIAVGEIIYSFGGLEDSTFPIQRIEYETGIFIKADEIGDHGDHYRFPILFEVDTLECV